jgi:hypothetical protein
MPYTDLLINLEGSRVRQIRQEAARIVVEIDDTADGPIRVICEDGEFAHQSGETMGLNQLPPWHHARVVAWADVVADCLIVALESGNRFALRAQSLRVERGV